MKTFTVSFFGHRYLTDFKTLEDELEELVSYLLMTHEERQAYFNEKPVKPLRKFWEII